MSPQILAWPFQPLLYPFLAIPPQCLFPALSSCSIVLLTHSPPRPWFVFLPIAKSGFGCSFLMSSEVVSCYCLCCVVCQVCVSGFCFLLPPSLVIPLHIKKVFDQITFDQHLPLSLVLDV